MSDSKSVKRSLAQREEEAWEGKPHAEVSFIVPFHDVDMLMVAWHGHYYKYFELGRTELFKRYNMDVQRIRDLGFKMVVSDSSCRYIHPLRYDMKVTCLAVLVEVEYRLEIHYRLRDENGKILAKGKTIHVTLDADNQLRITPKAIMEAFAQES